MSYRNNHLLILRGCPTPDPTAAGYIEAELAVMHVGPPLQLLGDNGTAGDGRLYGRERFRRLIEIECVGFSRVPGDDRLQDWGMYERLVQAVFSKKFGTRHIYIWRAYEDGAFHSSGPLQRAFFDVSNIHNPVSNLAFWNLRPPYTDPEGFIPNDPPGHLPLLVVLEGDIKPNHEGEGNYSLSFTLKIADPDF